MSPLPTEFTAFFLRFKALPVRSVNKLRKPATSPKHPTLGYIALQTAKPKQTAQDTVTHSARTFSVPRKPLIVFLACQSRNLVARATQKKLRHL
jgi:hypothetical protein